MYRCMLYSYARDPTCLKHIFYTLSLFTNSAQPPTDSHTCCVLWYNMTWRPSISFSQSPAINCYTFLAVVVVLTFLCRGKKVFLRKIFHFSVAVLHFPTHKWLLHCKMLHSTSGCWNRGAGVKWRFTGSSPCVPYTYELCMDMLVVHMYVCMSISCRLYSLYFAIQ